MKRRGLTLFIFGFWIAAMASLAVHAPNGTIMAICAVGMMIASLGAAVYFDATETK